MMAKDPTNPIDTLQLPMAKPTLLRCSIQLAFWVSFAANAVKHMLMTDASLLSISSDIASDIDSLYALMRN